VIADGSTRLPRRRHRHGRDVLSLLGFGLWLVVLVPPIFSWARDYEFVQAVQFCIFAVAVPCLVVVGDPWRRLSSTPSAPVSYDVEGASLPVPATRLVDRLAQSVNARRGHARVVALLIVFIVQAIAWRSTPVVDALVRHPWLSIVESLCLVGSGVPLWLELVESPPFRPRATRPYRIGVAALAMWTIWVIAYLMAMSQDPWYRTFHQVSRPLLSLAADQQLTTGLMWFIAAAAFMPIVFSNLNQWLKSEDDPDEELYQLVRKDRTRGFFGTNS